jgi:hypothetical protein
VRRQALGDAAQRCADCRKPGDPSAGPSLGFRFHHIKPWSEGGEHTADNIVPLCLTCHFARHGQKPASNPKPREPERSVWAGMLSRCNNPTNASYHHYGGRGIKVCERWQGPQGYANFKADLGPRPSRAHSLDRADNNRGYTPRNCRWATAAEQGLNRSNNTLITWNGKRQTLTEWSRETGLTISAISKRLEYKWPLDRVFTQPMRERKPPKQKINEYVEINGKMYHLIER